MKKLQRIICFPELKEIIGLGRARIYQLMEEGTFPKQIKISARAIGWKAKEIQNWIDAREQVK